jgi:hypothetical protein
MKRKSQREGERGRQEHASEGRPSAFSTRAHARARCVWEGDRQGGREREGGRGGEGGRGSEREREGGTEREAGACFRGAFQRVQYTGSCKGEVCLIYA